MPSQMALLPASRRPSSLSSFQKVARKTIPWRRMTAASMMMSMALDTLEMITYSRISRDIWGQLRQGFRVMLPRASSLTPTIRMLCRVSVRMRLRILVNLNFAPSSLLMNGLDSSIH